MFEFLLGTKKKTNETDMSQATANEFIGVKDIRGSILTREAKKYSRM